MEMKELSEMVAVALNGIVEKEVEKVKSENTVNVDQCDYSKLLDLLNEIEASRHEVLDRFVRELGYVPTDNLEEDDLPESLIDYIIDEHRNDIISDYISELRENDYIDLVEENCTVKDVVVRLIERNL